MALSLYDKNSLAAVWFFVVFYVVYGIFLTVRQESIIYQPSPQDFSTCPNLVQAEKITHGGTRMYFKDNGPRVAVLYHGNFGSACDRAFIAGLFEQAGYSYLLPEYAGYSNDNGKPSHERIKKDVEHAVDFLRTRNFSEVVVVGESVGDRFASYHASLLPPKKLLLISSFTTLVDIAREAFWFYPISLLVRDEFDNAHLLEDFQKEVVLLHGDKDDIIPLALGQKLFAQLTTPHKKMILIPGAGHNDLFAFPETYQAIDDFLKEGQ